MSFHVLVTPRSFAQWDDSPQILLEKSGFTVERNPLQRPLTEDELVERAQNADGLIVGIDPVSRRVIASARRLRVISKYGVGVDNIDLAAATRRGIVVTFTPGANTEAVADLTFGMLIAAARRIAEADRAVKEGRWERFMGVDIWGRTLGIIGAGQIGKAVARRAQGFNMKVIAFDVRTDREWAADAGVEYTGLEELMTRSDFIAIHLALTDATRGLIGRDLIGLMKQTAVLVNTARGGIIDEEALTKALNEGKIFGAALDVFSEEPVRNERLLAAQGLVATPHIGAYSRGALGMMGLIAAENLIAVFNGLKPEHVINPEAYNNLREGER